MSTTTQKPQSSKRRVGNFEALSVLMNFQVA